MTIIVPTWLIIYLVAMVTIYFIADLVEIVMDHQLKQAKEKRLQELDRARTELNNRMKEQFNTNENSEIRVEVDRDKLRDSPNQL